MKRRMVGFLFGLSILIGGVIEHLAAQEKPYEIVVAMLTVTGRPEGLEELSTAISAITVPKIGATVKLLPIDMTSYEQQINLMLAGREPLDLMMCFYSYGQRVGRKELLPMDDLLAKYGSGITGALGPDIMKVVRINGAVYGVPAVRDFASAGGFEARRDVLDRVKVKPESIRTLNDLEGLMAKLKVAYPGMTLGVTGGATFTDYWNSWDPLGDNLGVLMNNGQSTKVVNLFETKEYADLVKKIRDWFNKGYLYKDTYVNRESGDTLMRAEKIWGNLSRNYPYTAAGNSIAAGRELVDIDLFPPISISSSVLGNLTSIPNTSRDPVKAMKFLNLLYTDQDVVNLVASGIEGKHYVKLANGKIDYAPSATKELGLFQLRWQWGNPELAYELDFQPTGWRAMIRAYNQTAIKSKALGFVFDTSKVKTKVALLNNVVAKYRTGIENGVLDPDRAIPEFNSKLKKAGLDDVIAEKQRQFDAWLASNR